MSNPANDRRFNEELLSAYLDGECSTAEHAEVERRVAEEQMWRNILDEVALARSAVRNLPDREPPAGFWLRVLTNVAEIAERDRSGDAAAAVVSIARPARRRVPRWGAVAAASIAVVGGVALAAPQRHHTVSPNVASLTDSHAASASMQSDPLSNLAPAAVPVKLSLP
jgi:negative regulator of sigma E activity